MTYAIETKIYTGKKIKTAYAIKQSKKLIINQAILNFWVPEMGNESLYPREKLTANVPIMVPSNLPVVVAQSD